jgi:hypothetical protein
VHHSALDIPIGAPNTGANAIAGTRSVRGQSTHQLVIVHSPALAMAWSIVERAIG